MKHKCPGYTGSVKNQCMATYGGGGEGAHFTPIYPLGMSSLMTSGSFARISMDPNAKHFANKFPEFSNVQTLKYRLEIPNNHKKEHLRSQNPLVTVF